MTVVAPLWYEHYLSGLYGSRSYHGYVGEVDFQRWRGDVERVIGTIKKCIDLNVVSDQKHIRDLVVACERGAESIHKSGSLDEGACAAIKTLSTLCFLLIGEHPNHFFESRPFAEKYWYLKGERSIGYTQTPNQKAKAIVNLERWGQIGDASKQTIQSLYHRMGSEQFIEWFKSEYTEEYLEWF